MIDMRIWSFKIWVGWYEQARPSIHCHPLPFAMQPVHPFLLTAFAGNLSTLWIAQMSSFYIMKIKF